MSKRLIIALTLIATLFALSAAAETAPSSSATTNQRLLDNLKFSYYGLYRGPQITKPNSSYQPSDEGTEDESKKQVIESAFTLGYKLNPDVTISAMHNFLLYPLGTSKTDGGFDMKFSNPAFRIAHTSLYDNKQGLSLAGAFRFYFPAARAAHDSHLFTQLRTDETLNQDLQGTRWSLGMDMTQRLWLYSSDVAKGGDGLNSYYFLFSPYGGYQVNDKISVKFGFEKEMAKPFAENATFDTSGMMEGFVGVSWDAHPKLNLSPSISFHPNNMKMNVMQAFLELTAKVL